MMPPPPKVSIGLIDGVLTNNIGSRRRSVDYGHVHGKEGKQSKFHGVVQMDEL